MIRTSLILSGFTQSNPPPVGNLITLYQDMLCIMIFCFRYRFHVFIASNWVTKNWMAYLNLWFLIQLSKPCPYLSRLVWKKNVQDQDFIYLEIFLWRFQRCQLIKLYHTGHISHKCLISKVFQTFFAFSFLLIFSILKSELFFLLSKQDWLNVFQRTMY